MYSTNTTPLYNRYGDTAALARLLQRGCPVDAADYGGRSLLHVVSGRVLGGGWCLESLFGSCRCWWMWCFVSSSRHRDALHGQGGRTLNVLYQHHRAIWVGAVVCCQGVLGSYFDPYFCLAASCVCLFAPCCHTHHHHVVLCALVSACPTLSQAVANKQEVSVRNCCEACYQSC